MPLLARHRGNGPHPHADTTGRLGRPGRRLSLWYGGAIVALMPMAIFLVMAAFYAIRGSTLGDLTTTSAAALEAGAAPASHWIEVSGVADTRDSIQITHTGRARWTEWYVPVIATGREPAAHATVDFLSIDDHRRSQFSKTASAFSGTLSITSLPNQAEAYFARHGLSVDPHHLLVKFGETPADVLTDAKELGWSAAGFAAVAAICFVIARGRSKRVAA
jgi:hypothetical protein